MNVEIAPNNLLPSLIQRICRAQAERLKNIRVAAGIGPRAEFSAYTEERREQRGLDQLGLVIVDLIFETGIASCIGALLPLQNDRAAVWHDQTCPNQQHAGLAKRDLTIIDAY